MSRIASRYSAIASSSFPWASRAIAEVVVGLGGVGLEPDRLCAVRRSPRPASRRYSLTLGNLGVGLRAVPADSGTTGPPRASRRWPRLPKKASACSTPPGGRRTDRRDLGLVTLGSRQEATGAEARRLVGREGGTTSRASRTARISHRVGLSRWSSSRSRRRFASDTSRLSRTYQESVDGARPRFVIVAANTETCQRA